MRDETDVEGLVKRLDEMAPQASHYGAWGGGVLMEQAAAALRSLAEENERLQEAGRRLSDENHTLRDRLSANAIRGKTLEQCAEEIDALTRQLQEAVELLVLARCPDEDCDGNGTKVRVVPVCCGAMDADGCCGRPLPEPQPEQCQWCHERVALTERSKP